MNVSSSSRAAAATAQTATMMMSQHYNIRYLSKNVRLYNLVRKLSLFCCSEKMKQIFLEFLYIAEQYTCFYHLALEKIYGEINANKNKNQGQKNENCVYSLLSLFTSYFISVRTCIYFIQENIIMSGFPETHKKVVSDTILEIVIILENYLKSLNAITNEFYVNHIIKK